ncbi:probable plastid-lipid-associated protein 10, chloroplastic [Selaginella moellendorffii]|uniref:probable plastid-lipid-associated protein 10, chloroplastic n=1 Tax=Selaginella moellendorffii TaxID=88036 RepID=UPI000D1C6440|nr:probable plastid-lipid-associated protein 10, chloroplastic [Selaginella moellendorffii]|eukprot:XP_024520475.1 probable plastid-lipid-associated protein 10, chloroplastic [Selaginella moellendorffii]
MGFFTHPPSLDIIGHGFFSLLGSGENAGISRRPGDGAALLLLESLGGSSGENERPPQGEDELAQGSDGHEQGISSEPRPARASRGVNGTALDLDKLDGTWLLQYTSAPDVLSILQAGEFPFFKAGQIYQKFECKGRFDGGQVVNVVRWSIPGLLQDAEGATLFVTAGFSVVSARTIQLEFKEARLGEVLISEEVQALLAPAVLPRTFLNLQILQAINSLDVRVPLRGRRPSNERRSLGLLYYLTYLDNDMLLGRAIGSGGVFVFGKTQSF